MSVAEVKKSNRAIQRQHITYKGKAEISEALHLTRPYINQSTYKFLCHFLHTNGTGVTQAKIDVICQKAGIAERTYYKIVKPEIDGLFSQPLIITTPAPMKFDKKRKKKVKASPFKSLMPLSVIKHLIRLKESEELEMYAPDWDEIEESAGKSAGKSAGECDSSNPWESKDEDAFLPQQNKSFRENHLENPINNNRLSDYPPKGEFKVYPKIQTFVSGLPFDESQQPRVGKEIQLALKATRTKMSEDVEPIIFGAIARFIREYIKGGKLRDSDKYYRVLYKCIETDLQGYFSQTEEVIEGTQKTIVEHRHIHTFERNNNGDGKRKGFLGLLDDMEQEEPQQSRKDITPEVDNLRDLINLEQANKSNRTPIRQEMKPHWLDNFLDELDNTCQKSQEAPEGRKTVLEGEYITQGKKTQYEPISEVIIDMPF